MKKLTRYTDFNSLKLDVKPTDVNVKPNEDNIQEMKDFLELLRSKLHAGKELKKHKSKNGQ